MKMNLLALCALWLSMSAFAGISIDVKNADGTITPIAGAAGQITHTLTVDEDEINSVSRVEQQNGYSGSKVADWPVKAAPGFVHTINCMGDGSALASGTVILYDSLTEGGAIIWQGDFAITGNYASFTVILDNVATIGLYLGYTTATDIRCSVSFR